MAVLDVDEVETRITGNPRPNHIELDQPLKLRIADNDIILGADAELSIQDRMAIDDGRFESVLAKGPAETARVG